MSLNNKYALITGPTSGIEYELAKLFAQEGYNLILVARTEYQLIKVSNELMKDFNVDFIAGASITQRCGQRRVRGADAEGK